MNFLGISLETKGFRYVVLSGSKAAPEFVDKGKVALDYPNIGECLDGYETSFQTLVSKFSPERIGVKLTLDAKKDQIRHWYYPYALLHKMAYDQNIELHEFIPGNFVASKFGFPKGANVYEHVDKVIGTHPPHWDKNQKYAALAAMIMLP